MGYTAHLAHTMEAYRIGSKDSEVSGDKMDKVAGKKLLILGASIDEVSLVKRAQMHGVYAIVTDYYTDRQVSLAKKYADEAWDISWSDIDLLEQMCRENHVDGITAGYSEMRVDCLIRLCEKLSLPCYITKAQLEITRNKREFKKECLKCGVPVINEYKTPQQVDRFPVIIKPVDRGGSIGISVASNAEELAKAYEYAMEKSLCKDVIIEDFITDGMKIDSFYFIKDGVPILTGICDTLNSVKNETSRVVQNGWLHPSRVSGAYEEKVDHAIRNMIVDMGISTGYIDISGFADSNDEFAFFEIGFRLSGGHSQDYFPLKGFANQMDLFIYHALLGDKFELELGKATNKNVKCATVNIYAKSGVIREISGFEQVAKLPDCVSTYTYANVGQECTDKNAILTKVGMMIFCSEDSESLAADITKAYGMVKILDGNGCDMVYDRIDTTCVRTWWD